MGSLRSAVGGGLRSSRRLGTGDMGMENVRVWWEFPQPAACLPGTEEAEFDFVKVTVK